MRPSRSSTRAWPRSWPPIATPWPSTWATPTPTTSTASSTAASCSRRCRTRNVYSASTVDQIPKQLASALMFGTGTTVAGPRRRPHRPSAHAGRQSVGLQRQPHDRARHARPAARAARPRRQARGDRPAAHPDRRGGRRASLHPPRHRRAAAVRARPRALRARTWPTPATVWPRSPTASTRSASWPSRSLRTRSRPPAASRRGEIRRMARELAAAPTAAVYGRIGTCTQEFGTLASWLVDVLNVLTGNLDRAGGAMFPLGAAGHSNASGEPGRGRGARLGRFASRVRGLGEVFGELPVGVPGRGDRHPGRGPGPRPHHPGRQPGHLHAQQRASRRRPGPRWTSWSRSTSTSTRPPATPTSSSRRPRRCAAATTTSRSICSRCATSPTTRRRRSSPTRPCPTSGSRCCAWPASPPGWARMPTWRRSTRVWRALAIAREIDTPRSPLHGRTQDEMLEALAPRVGPERLLDLMLRAGPYGDGFGARARGRPQPQRPRGRPARHRPRARSSPACRTRCGPAAA